MQSDLNPACTSHAGNPQVLMLGGCVLHWNTWYDCLPFCLQRSTPAQIQGTTSAGTGRGTGRPALWNGTRLRYRSSQGSIFWVGSVNGRIGPDLMLYQLNSWANDHTDKFHTFVRLWSQWYLHSFVTAWILQDALPWINTRGSSVP